MSRLKVILLVIFGRCRARYSRYRNEQWEIESWGFYSRKGIYLGTVSWEPCETLEEIIEEHRAAGGFKTIGEIRDEWINKNPGRILNE